MTISLWIAVSAKHSKRKLVIPTVLGAKPKETRKGFLEKVTTCYNADTFKHSKKG